MERTNKDCTTSPVPVLILNPWLKTKSLIGCWSIETTNQPDTISICFWFFFWFFGLQVDSKRGRSIVAFLLADLDADVGRHFGVLVAAVAAHLLALRVGRHAHVDRARHLHTVSQSVSQTFFSMIRRRYGRQAWPGCAQPFIHSEFAQGSATLPPLRTVARAAPLPV